jgi:hypothetical protein
VAESDDPAQLILIEAAPHAAARKYLRRRAHVDERERPEH